MKNNFEYFILTFKFKSFAAICIVERATESKPLTELPECVLSSRFTFLLNPLVRFKGLPVDFAGETLPNFFKMKFI